jgi:hypothetical protein
MTYFYKRISSRSRDAYIGTGQSALRPRQKTSPSSKQTRSIFERLSFGEKRKERAEKQTSVAGATVLLSENTHHLTEPPCEILVLLCPLSFPSFSLENERS